MTSRIFYFWNSHLRGFLLLSDQLPLYLECNFSFNLPHHTHEHKQIKPLVHTDMERANTILYCQSMSGWWCMKQWQCNRMCYYLGIIFPRFGLASPMSENGKKGLERLCWLFIPLTAPEGDGSLYRPCPAVWGRKEWGVPFRPGLWTQSWASQVWSGVQWYQASPGGQLKPGLDVTSKAYWLGLGARDFWNLHLFLDCL